MRSLAPAELLDAWEHASAAAAASARAAALLAEADGAAPLDELLDLPIGELDAKLLELRAQLIGLEVEATTTCPSCAQEVELAFALDAVRVHPSRPIVRVERGGYEVWCRSPTMRDLESVDASSDVRRRLLEHCVERVVCKGDDAAVSDLPEKVVDAVDEALEVANSQADVLLGLTCPDCGRQWNGTFDVGSFLWTEVETMATGLLIEIDALARAYGWREPDILSLTPRRRRHYLELVLG